MICRPLRSILVAVEASPECGEVLDAAAALAAHTGAALHVVHAYSFPRQSALVPPDAPVRWQDRIAAAQAELHGRVAAATRGAGAASVTVAVDLPHRAIRARALAVDAELIVMGPNRHRGVEHRFLGSTTDRVVRTVRAPCLVVRGALAPPLRRVVVPVDLSEPARDALGVAAALAQGLGGAGTELRVVHVLPPAWNGAAPPAEAAPELRREVERALGDPAPAVRQELLRGDDPAEAIVQHARATGAELVVVATHGRGAISRLLIGSVAAGVARDAPCSVVLVPPAIWLRPEEPEWDEPPAPLPA